MKKAAAHSKLPFSLRAGELAGMNFSGFIGVSPAVEKGSVICRKINRVFENWLVGLKHVSLNPVLDLFIDLKHYFRPDTGVGHSPERWLKIDLRFRNRLECRSIQYT